MIMSTVLAFGGLAAVVLAIGAGIVKMIDDEQAMAARRAARRAASSAVNEFGAVYDIDYQPNGVVFESEPLA